MATAQDRRLPAIEARLRRSFAESGLGVNLRGEIDAQGFHDGQHRL
jgi:hypothetical protein